jgi:hypothetical protein
VFENRVLRRIYRPKREEVAGGWRRPHTEELHNLYASPNFIRAIKSRWMRWTEHVARMGEMHSGFWLEHLTLRDHLEDLDGDGNIILEHILV